MNQIGTGHHGVRCLGFAGVLVDPAVQGGRPAPITRGWKTYTT